MKTEYVILPIALFSILYSIYKADAFLFSFSLMILAYILANARDRTKLDEKELKVLKGMINDLELDERQRKILDELTMGKGISEIAKEMNVSRNTVYKEVRLILKKMEVLRGIYEKLEDLAKEG